MCLMKNNFSKVLAPEEKEGKAKTRQEARKLCAVILAIFKMPFMHRLTQSMAENTYVRSRGKNIIKTKIAENTSNTLEQQKVRVRMKLAEFLSRVFYTPAQVAFPQRRRDLTALNACVQAIMRAITVNDDLEATVDYATMQIAKGNLAMLDDISITLDAESRTFTVSYPAGDYGYGSEPTDTLQIVLFEQELMRCKMFEAGTRGEDGNAILNIPTKWNPEEVLAYAFMLSANKRKASNSEYIAIS